MLQETLRSTFPLSPLSVLKREGDEKMRVLKELLFAVILMSGLALGVYADEGQDKKPPKNPPVVNPGNKPPPPPTPTPKKP